MLDIVKYLSRDSELNRINEKKIGCFERDMSVGSLLQDGPTLRPCSNYLELIDQNLRWNVKEIRKLSAYAHLADRLEALRSDLSEICDSHPLANNLDFKDQKCVLHGDLNSTNILVDAEGRITAILDWEFCSHSFDRDGLGFISGWFMESEERTEMAERIKKIERDSFFSEFCEKKSGAQIRSHMHELLGLANQLTFYSSSWFAKELRDGGLERAKLQVRRHIDMHAQLLVAHMAKTPLYIEMLKKF